jgi:C1A family cysteine protease
MANHTYNWIPSPPDSRDLIFKPPTIKTLFAIQPPTSVDLRKQCSPVVDQGALGSCTGNAIASGLREFMLLKSSTPFVPLSRLFIYYQERVAEGTTLQDAGADLRDGMDCVLNLGVCRESLDPYHISQFTEAPTPEAMADAAKYKISSYMSVKGITSVKQCLAQGYPVVAGMDVFNQFESREAATTGIVRIPPLHEQPIGGHAVTVVGYQDTPRYTPGYWKGGGYWWMRNSWSENWGIKGYFKLAYDYTNLGYMQEFWTAR